jgi:release factor glutamine methyltransferase
VATVQELLDVGVARLRESGSESARLDAEVLLAHALDTDRTGVLAHTDAPVGDGSAARYQAALDRRAGPAPGAENPGVNEFEGVA